MHSLGILRACRAPLLSWLALMGLLAGILAGPGAVVWCHDGEGAGALEWGMLGKCRPVGVDAEACASTAPSSFDDGPHSACDDSPLDWPGRAQGKLRLRDLPAMPLAVTVPPFLWTAPRVCASEPVLLPGVRAEVVPFALLIVRCVVLRI